jgi:ADP-ribose pyrophosphatase YjhB (NUDIX family)
MIFYRLLTLWLALVKPVSTGVRVLLIKDGQVMLVRHTYQDGWHLPGGGAKRMELLEAAARREAREEAGAKLGPVSLFGIFTNLSEGRTDHIAVFLCEDFTYTGLHDGEIAELRAFPLEAIPADTLPGHRRRVEDYRRGVEISGQFGAW